MPEFHHSFTVHAPLPTVTMFHLDPVTLRRVTPPPVWIQFHHVEPEIIENALSEFSMWFGPFRVFWRVQHVDVQLPHHFTDIQQVGPLKKWVHIHAFTAESETTTLVTDIITYEHSNGCTGLLTRILFNHFMLALLFAYRKIMTRSYLR